MQMKNVLSRRVHRTRQRQGTEVARQIIKMKEIKEKVGKSED